MGIGRRTNAHDYAIALVTCRAHWAGARAIVLAHVVHEALTCQTRLEVELVLKLCNPRPKLAVLLKDFKHHLLGVDELGEVICSVGRIRQVKRDLETILYVRDC